MALERVVVTDKAREFFNKRGSQDVIVKLVTISGG